MNSFDIALVSLIEAALKEDIGSGDHSTLSCIPASQQGKALLKIKQAGILAGVEVAKKIFNFIEPSAQFVAFKKDGDQMQVGETAFEITATVHTILKGERLVLNCMQRMCGIATLTNRYTQLLKGYHTRILDTRKTTPNFRLLEKEAVKIGGGMNHRFGLYDMIMLKDNHIDYCGGIIEAINQAYAYSNQLEKPLKIEVETRNLSDVELVCNKALNKVDRIMLDNFSPEAVSQALAIIQGRVETEASGGINLTTIESFAKTGVDFVSVGGLIHQAQSLDLSLKASFMK
ncbi:carboxylating nicotinate-nucleotide diphosphorylase [Sediminibacterium sp.]|jgi:nicotinate-nucleotide pyrophosphorylase (carboxylating)|uniref:carboxylating nicotinate-nucleotide diphosphorylase n=1 Tax=Sediminibacterium sp. TaxID=1917865 RepID=UPI002722B387|nr:carboxylating nicotinate-nucleotide diphosphorylase [Sediminibacterium sp.]MDO9157195.1 carboxylating nicotinate-nucleotide diphosphorylase [Sediminibacterium sp.]MDP2422537.1 carboxylating nicotinate-nucleotide diphosphorylase [Sediminibacterium sp.]